LLQTASNPHMDLRLLAICGVSMVIVLTTRLHLLWLMLSGAVLGSLLAL
ncbi:MAG: chromate transporter, partial [Betaproteobacteria bacterium]|nr:chromate transporter [Betaproteobacteria bacterium]